MTPYYEPSSEANNMFETENKAFEDVVSLLRSKHAALCLGPLDDSDLYKAWNIAKYWHGDVKRTSGGLFILHPLAVCKKLIVEGYTDLDLLTAALLHDTVENTSYTLAQLLSDFNSEVCAYVDGLTVPEVRNVDHVTALAEKKRYLMEQKLISACKTHPLTLLIKFCDRWHNLRTSQRLDQSVIADAVTQTRRFLIPLARDNGYHHMAIELEDACMRAENPRVYANISDQCERAYRDADHAYKKDVERLTTRLQGFATVDELLRPTVYEIVEELKRTRSNAALTRSNLFHYYKYQPYVYVPIRITNPTSEPLNKQFLDAVKPLLGALLTIETERTRTDLARETVVEVELTDEYQNRLKVILYTKEFKHTPAAAAGLRIAAPIPPDKRMDVYDAKSGEKLTVHSDSTVLDYAFAYDVSIAVRYTQAFVNGKVVTINHKLSPGDSVRILKSEGYTACLDWFHILETKSAVQMLADHLSQREAEQKSVPER